MGAGLFSRATGTVAGDEVKAEAAEEAEEEKVSLQKVGPVAMVEATEKFES